MNNYFIYRHIRLDKNEVFYIGLGQNKKRPVWRWNRNRYWKHITNQTDYKVEIMLDGLTRKQAEDKENEFIELYGRKDLGTGTLCNLTNGGFGGWGYKHTYEAKQKMKGRVSHNKGLCKWDHLLQEIKNDLDSGMSERQIIEKHKISKGGLHRIKLKIKQIRQD